MLDGLYQSLVVWFFVYALFSPATFNSQSGLDVSDIKRMGVYVASNAVVVVNLYMLFNVYRWDWFQLLIVAISILLIWFWTGIYTAFTAGFTFYKSAPQVYGQLTFWALLLLTVIICLLPRFAGKSYQKLYRPRDVDIIREQIRQGKFDYLKHEDNLTAPAAPEEKRSLASSNSNGLNGLKQPPRPSGNGHSKKGSHDSTKPVGSRNYPLPADGDTESTRPMYASSIAPTAITTTTHNPRSTNGSDGTDYTGHFIGTQGDVQGAQKTSFERGRPSFDRPRPSFDRARLSMDRVRPSFEQAPDFTSAAQLMRMESSQSGVSPVSPSRLRRGWSRGK